MVSINNDMLEMLTSREQLMEDIISIVDEYDMKKGFATKDELAEFLCDAVCRNFPAKWYLGQPLRSNSQTVHYRLISSPDPVL